MKNEPNAYRAALRVALAVALMLCVPLVAMRFTDEVRWSPFDFVVAGALLLGTGLAYQAAARRARGFAYRAAVAVALGAALLLVWSNLAVGVIGDARNPANLMYAGVLAVQVVGTVLARWRPEGMTRALFATALAQSVAAAVALVLRLAAPAEIVAVNGMFAALFVASALMFRHAGRAAAARLGA